MGVGCLLLAFGLGLLSHDLILLQKTSKYNALLLENKILKEKFNDMNRELERVQSHLDRVQTFATKLRLITSLEDPQRNQALTASRAHHGQESAVDPETGIQMGAADPFVAQLQIPPGEQPKEEMVFPFYQQENDYILPKLYQFESKLRRVSLKSSHQDMQIQALYEMVRDQHTLLRSTPSILPARGFISSYFGFRSDPFTGLRRMHTGLDVSTQRGTPIYAPADGMVLFSGRKTDYGNLIVVEHGYGITTRYGHNDQNLVRLGQKVKRGDLIGYVGSTGRTSGPHLHYEVRVNEIPVDPMNFILDEFGPMTSADIQRSGVGGP
jgi:murein DD-endopeptidase MepM/ murein hydrolase activator NlpD